MGYTMKGSPMQRNFGIGSPLRDKPVKGGTLSTVEVKGGKGGKSRAQRDYEAKLERLASEEMGRGTVTGSPREGYKEAYAKLPESKKRAYRAAAQKREAAE